MLQVSSSDKPVHIYYKWKLRKPISFNDWLKFGAFSFKILYRKCSVFSKSVWNLKLYISCESNQDDIQINVSLLDPVKTVKNSYKQDNI